METQDMANMCHMEEGLTEIRSEVDRAKGAADK